MINVLINKRLGGEVKRFHTVPMLKEHLVASHSWGVALHVQHIHPDCRKELIIAALEHDIHEHITGDMSAVTKWDFPMMAHALNKVEDTVNIKLGITPNLTPFEEQVLKTADMADLVLCCFMEYQLGNQAALKPIIRGIDFLADFCTVDCCALFYEELCEYVVGKIGLGVWHDSE